jgi:hypothetical protein
MWIKEIVILLSLALALPAFARNQAGDNWYFGYDGGVTFVNGVPNP